ncbi:hypothetical protein COCCADRAFT_110671 [Bipolaris zeicola 26-R-13]|uniref:Uncharacterized protein n=1 Tax=Cochliobolus carbonum (strain 26-R-13) TaxID=930089 RepID=W6XRA0_COCC2|nr:uncharacterized protein COCCADRAFT_110671 [Bipolaris zeicola 26-R-13]EUC27840.1 hypothetical protein COCCADRAFT_110671 [Bipolaris zeicola 26-R-13]
MTFTPKIERGEYSLLFLADDFRYIVRRNMSSHACRLAEFLPYICSALCFGPIFYMQCSRI